MFLDQRSKELLHVLIENPNIYSKEIELELGLTRRQIKYSIGKINTWLLNNNFPKIERYKNGQFIIDPTLFELPSDAKLIDHTNYNLSEEERILLILYILLSQDDLSLFHFTDTLKVSNVTILNDMKKAQKLLDSYKLNIVYTRIDGYNILEEWSKRNVLQYLTQKIYHYYDGSILLEGYTAIPEKGN